MRQPNPECKRCNGIHIRKHISVCCKDCFPDLTHEEKVFLDLIEEEFNDAPDSASYRDASKPNSGLEIGKNKSKRTLSNMKSKPDFTKGKAKEVLKNVNSK